MHTRAWPTGLVEEDDVKKGCGPGVPGDGPFLLFITVLLSEFSTTGETRK